MTAPRPGNLPPTPPGVPGLPGPPDAPGPQPPGRATGGLDDVDWSQWSVIFCKPDCVRRGLTGKILAWIGTVVQVSAVRTVTVTEQQIFTHYADLFPRAAEIGVDIAAELRRMHVGHRAVIALGHGPDAPARLRALIGPTDPAAAGPDTIRGRYGIDTLAVGQAERRLIDNLIHTSDDADAARRDVALWYGTGPLPPATPLTLPPATPSPRSAP